MTDRPTTAIIATYASLPEADADLERVVAAHGDAHLGHLEAGVFTDDGRGAQVQRHERLGGLRGHFGNHASDDLTRVSWTLPGDPVSLVVLCSDGDVAALEAALAGAKGTRTQVVDHPSAADEFFEGSSAMDTPPDSTRFEDGEVGHLGV
jgi:hypothetical protein